MNLKLSALIIILFLAIFPMRIYAVSPSSISMNITPENPAPFEEVNISLESYSADLDSVSISWFVNGKNVFSGMGKKSLSLSAPAAGAESSVVARIAFPDGEVELRTTLKPSVFTMLWQTKDSYVPPFYKGKALPTAGNTIKVVAMPEIKRGGAIVNPKTMTYAWKIDYSNDQAGSGYGKIYFIFDNDFLENSNNITVRASTTDQKYSAEGKVNIETTEPKIVFYKKDAKMRTMFEKAVPDGYKIEEADTLEAVPYFISPNNPLHPFLIWTWCINDSPVSLPQISKNSIPLKAEEGVSGSARIRLRIENTEQIFQTAEKEINVEF